MMQKNKPSKALQSFILCWVILLSIAFLPYVSAFNWNDGSLISYYKLDETTGNIAYDIFNLNNMSNFNGKIGTAGKVNTAYYFNGTSYASAISSSSLNAYGNLSVAFWFKVNHTAGNSNLITKFKDAGNQRQWQIYVGSGKVIFQVSPDGNSGTLTTATSPETILANTWYFVTAVYNSTGLNLYLNGSLSKSTLYTSGIFKGNGNLSFGKYEDVPVTAYMNGTLDEIAIWNRTITASEALELYNSGFGYSYGNLIENSQTYNANTTKGNLEEFIINITYDSTYYPNIVGNLIYNGVSYSGVKSGTGDNISFSKSINVPTIAGTYNFYWSIGLINSTGTFYFNSSVRSQGVGNLDIDDCSVYTNQILNYTLRDERTQDVMNGTYYNSTIDVDLQMYSSDRTILVTNFSKTYANTSNARVCLKAGFLSTDKYSLDVQAKYSSDGYVTRNNYMQNYTLSSSTALQKITLFGLASAFSTEFLISFKDENFLAVENALISINRKYVGEGVFKTVEVSKTDQSGQALGHFDLAGVTYSITVSKYGRVLASFNNTAIFCEDKITQNCKINLYASTAGIKGEDFYTSNNLGYTISFNQATRTARVEFNTLDNSVATISINATVFDGYGNTTACSNMLSSSSGTVDCVILASFGNITFYVSIYKDNNLISTVVFSIMQKATDTFGNNVVFFIIGVMITIPLMFIPSTIGVIIGSLISLIIAVLVFSISSSPITLIVGIVIAGGIIIWKINQGGGG